MLYVGPTKSSLAVWPIPINGQLANQDEIICVFLNTLYIELHNNQEHKLQRDNLMNQYRFYSCASYLSWHNRKPFRFETLTAKISF